MSRVAPGRPDEDDPGWTAAGVTFGVEWMESWFTAEPRSARQVRHAVRRCLGSADLRVVGEVELLASELFAQAVAAAAGQGRIRVRIGQADRHVHVEVAHEQGYDDAAAVAARDPVEGAILDRLLEAFATSWGQSTSATGEHTMWFHRLWTG